MPSCANRLVAVRRLHDRHLDSRPRDARRDGRQRGPRAQERVGVAPLVVGVKAHVDDAQSAGSFTHRRSARTLKPVLERDDFRPRQRRRR